MKKSGNPETDQLLERGARSYLDAIVAITAFRREICKRCRTAIERRIEELREAFGGDFATDDIREWKDSDDASDQTYAFVGVGFKRPFPEEVYFEMWAGLYWTADGQSSSFGIEMSIWARETRARRLFKKMSKASTSKQSEIGEKDGDVWIATKLTPEQAIHFDSALDRVVSEWIKLGRKIGPIVKILGDDS